MSQPYEPSAADQERQRLLTSPGERIDAEYKASLPFDGNDSFTLKLLRQVQGMANGGGGWIVIGFKEDPPGVLRPDDNHSDEIAGSYDPTTVSKRVNKVLERGQPLAVTVHLEVHPNTGLRHPQIYVESMRRTPFICRSTVIATDTRETILEQGCVYLRRHGAETSKVSMPEDWDSIVSRAVRNRQDDFLDEFRQLLDRVAPPPAPELSAVEALREWAEASHVRAFSPDA